MIVITCLRGPLHKSTHANGRALKLETLVLQKSCQMYHHIMLRFDDKWEYLANLESAYPDFVTPDSVIRI